MFNKQQAAHSFDACAASEAQTANIMLGRISHAQRVWEGEGHKHAASNNPRQPFFEFTHQSSCMLTSQSHPHPHTQPAGGTRHAAQNALVKQKELLHDRSADAGPRACTQARLPTPRLVLAVGSNECLGHTIFCQHATHARRSDTATAWHTLLLSRCATSLAQVGGMKHIHHVRLH
jgi:hypothetical protein